MMVTIRKFSDLSALEKMYLAGHLSLYIRSEDLREALSTHPSDNINEVLSLVFDLASGNGDLNFAAYRDGLPVGAGGIVEKWPGVGSIWMLATTDWHRVANTATKFAKREVIPTAWQQGFHRLEARSIEGHDTAHRWMMYLGAKDEARLRSYGKSGEDFIVFSWFPPVG